MGNVVTPHYIRYATDHAQDVGHELMSNKYYTLAPHARNNKNGNSIENSCSNCNNYNNNYNYNNNNNNKKN